MAGMARRPRWIFPLLTLAHFLALWAATTSLSARAQETGATRALRPLEVTEPGWVRVALGPEVLRRLAGPGGGLRLYGPEGEEMAYLRRPAADRGERVPVEVLAVEGEAEGAGWVVGLDVGPVVGRHDRLVFELDRATTAPGVRLEASAEGSDWQLLGVGDLFRLGEGEGLARTGIVYPATGARYLRLHWPASAGYPRVREVQVETVPVSSFEVASRQPECRSDGVEPMAAAGPRTVCRLSVGFPGRSVRRLDLAVAAPGTSGPVGYRLTVPDGGSWRTVAEGLWRPPFDPAVPRSLELPALGELLIAPDGEGEPRPLGTLRLLLYGADADGEPVATLEGFSVQATGEVLVFRAEAAGRYSLAYGPAVASVGASELAGVPAAVETSWVEMGEESVETVAPAGGVPLPVAGAPLPEVEFGRRFPVMADGVAAGTVLRLPLPSLVYRQAGEDLAGLRLAAGGDQVPYVRWQPREPELAGTIPAEVPQPVAARAGVSRVVLDEVDLSLPLTSLELTASGLRFERRARAVVIVPERPGAEREIRLLADWAAWRCDPRPPLPCRVVLALERSSGELPEGTLLALEVDDGDDAPLRGIGIEVWRRRDVLVFVRPAGEAPLALLAGAETLAAPSYDLQAFEDELLARPWQPASAITAKAEAVAAGARWILLGTLVLAVVGLLVLLDRILRERTSG